MPAETTSETHPTLHVAGARATITLCRPAQHNRIDPQDIDMLLGHFDKLSRSSDVRVLVLTGSGEKTFSSGYTIDAIRSRLDGSFERMLDRLETLALPTVCALNGSVYGGGTDLAMCCDFRIGVQGSRMFMPAARFGLHYYPGGLRRFTARLGPTAAKKIFMTAQTLEAEEMLRIGYLTELVEPGQLDERVEAYATALEACEPTVVASMKQHIDALAAGTLPEGAGREAYDASLRSAELSRRLDALNRTDS